jgi:septum site-determining protein MinC
VTVLVRPQTGLGFRAHSLLAFVLAPHEPVLQWLADLDLWLERSPGFFVGKPVMLDLSALTADCDVYKKLVADLVERGVRVMAVEGCGVPNLSADLPPLVTGGRPASPISRFEDERSSDARNPEPPPKPPFLVIDAPVRSGQSIVYPEGDVTVIRSVASGAEIIAGGSIHVYGTLRGRALAGVGGNASARIFCRRLQAELLAVAGAYKTADEMEPGLLGQPVQAQLAGDEMIISALG